MQDSSDFVNNNRQLVTILDEYTEWFMQVVRRVAYPDFTDAQRELVEPVAFLDWTDDMNDRGFEPELVKSLNNLHKDLHGHADMLLSDAQSVSARQPSYEDFDKLMGLFEEFTHRIRRLGADILLDDKGIDSLTGLRSQTTLYKDLTREMDRLARHANQFSIALVRIDNLDKIREALGQEALEEKIIVVSEMVRKSVRSFDDSYRLEDEDFVLSLKQADISGGVKAMERLKRELEENNVSYELDGKTIPLSLSSVIAEPMPHDNVEELIANLKSDLSNSAKNEGTVLEYLEMSQLQRFVKQGGE